MVVNGSNSYPKRGASYSSFPRRASCISVTSRPVVLEVLAVASNFMAGQVFYRRVIAGWAMPIARFRFSAVFCLVS
jgi:hypothetical protein